MNTCEQVQEAMNRFVDGELPASGEAGVFTHASSCPDCRAFLRSSMELRAALLLSPSPAVPERLDRRILRLHPHQARVTALHRWWSTRLPLPLPAVAGAAVVVILLSILLMRAVVGQPPDPGATQAEYILTLEPIEVQGEPIPTRQNGVQF